MSSFYRVTEQSVEGPLKLGSPRGWPSMWWVRTGIQSSWLASLTAGFRRLGEPDGMCTLGTFQRGVRWLGGFVLEPRHVHEIQMGVCLQWGRTLEGAEGPLRVSGTVPQGPEMWRGQRWTLDRCSQGIHLFFPGREIRKLQILRESSSRKVTFQRAGIALLSSVCFAVSPPPLPCRPFSLLFSFGEEVSPLSPSTLLLLCLYQGGKGRSSTLQWKNTVKDSFPAVSLDRFLKPSLIFLVCKMDTNMSTLWLLWRLSEIILIHIWD